MANFVQFFSATLCSYYCHHHHHHHHHHQQQQQHHITISVENAGK